jgi:hypothetical protein
MAAYDSLHSLLDYECLLFHCDKWRTKHLLLMNSAERSHVSTFITTWGPNRDHRLEQLVVIFPLPRERVTEPLPSNGHIRHNMFWGGHTYFTWHSATGSSLSWVKRNSSITERAPHGSELSLTHSLHTHTCVSTGGSESTTMSVCYQSIHSSAHLTTSLTVTHLPTFHPSKYSTILSHVHGNSTSFLREELCRILGTTARTSLVTYIYPAISHTY